jgi:hypothetical protein
LNNEPAKDYSQNGEQAIIFDILGRLQLDPGIIVDLGAGDGWSASNSRALLESGWRGILIDCNNQGNAEVHEHLLTAENVVPIVTSYTTEMDVLSIDLDGNDYWILDAILGAIRPALIICEVNPRFERAEAWVMAYNPEHRWNETDYYGMSIGAVDVLCARHGYVLFDYNGLNAFLVRSELGLTPKNWTYSQRFDHPAGEGPWTLVSRKIDQP